MKSFLVLILVCASMACGRHETSGLSAVDQGERTPLIIFMGGYASCPKDPDLKTYEMMGASKIHFMFEASGFSKSMAELERLKGAKFLFSCYTALVQYTVFDTLYLRYSHDISFEKPREVQIRQSEIRAVPFWDSFLSYVEDYVTELQKESEVEVYIIGHSYGGWTAMRLAAHLTEHVQIETLITLDPISPLRCRAKDMFTDPLATLMQAHKGCGESPQDAQAQAAIKQITESSRPPKRWLNVYQDKFGYLHSGPITALDNFENASNWHYIYTSKNGPNRLIKDYHTHLGRDTRVWRTLRDENFKDLFSGLSLD